MIKFLVRILLQVIVVLITPIPLWIFMGVRGILNPTGFWQNLVVSGLGLYFLGTAQLFMLVLGIIASVIIWIEG